MEALVSLATREQSAEVKDWDEALANFISAEAKEWSPEDKSTVLNFFAAQLVKDQWPESTIVSALTTIKIISRSKTHLQALYTEEMFAWLSTFIQSSSIQPETQLEALRVILNLNILDMGKSAKLLSIREEHYLGLVQLLKGASRPAAYLLCRIIFYFALDKGMAKRLTQDATTLYDSLVSVVLTYSCYQNQLEGLSDKEDPAAAERRQVVSAALKVLFNLTVEQEVPERMHRKISDESFNEFGRAILAILSHGVEECYKPPPSRAERASRAAQRKKERKRRQARPDPLGYVGHTATVVNTSKEELNGLTGIVTSYDEVKERYSLKLHSDSTRLLALKPVNLECASSSNSNGLAQDTEARAETEERKDVDKEEEEEEEEEEETGRVVLASLPYVQHDTGSSSSSVPNSVDMVEVQTDVSHLLIYLPAEFVGIFTNYPKALEGLCRLMDRQAAKLSNVKKEGDRILTPILMTLNNVIKESHFARNYVKSRVFGDLADPNDQPEEKEDPSLSEGEKNKKNMEAKGPSVDSLAERGTMRYVLLKNVMALNYQLKQSVSEFLFNVCDGDSKEYLRLVGFGAGVGLLAEKGLPGFAGLTQKAINIDDVIKSGKKL